jgi:hypothetical protein
MTMATGNYFAYEFTDAKIQVSDGEVTPAIVEVDLLYANTIEISLEETTYTFEGDGQQRQFFATRGMTLQIRPDCLTLAAAETIFGKTAVTAGLPTGMDRLLWFGDAEESKGVSAGFVGRAIATKNDAGVETTMEIALWVPLGTLTLGGPPTLQTGQKAGQQTYRLSAVRTAVDVIGGALPTVPTGGAFYAISEV